MRVLLTGCTGWLGRSIVPYFRERYECDVLSRGATTEIMGDASLLRLFCQYDYIIHGAPVGASKILRQAGDAKVLFLSSGAAYCRQTPYAEAKRRDEAVLAGRAVIARLWSFVGSGMPEHYAIGEFLACLREHRPLHVRQPETVRSYMHVDDLGPALAAALLLPNGTVTNIGSPRPVTVEKVAQSIAAFGGLDVEVDEQTEPPDVYVPMFCADPPTSLAMAIYKTVCA